MLFDRDILTIDAAVEIATRSSLIASDLMVLCITWYHTYETAKLSLRTEVGQGKRTFASILLLDGVYSSPSSDFDVHDNEGHCYFMIGTIYFS